MCTKKQAEELVEVCEERWKHILESSGYIKVGLIFSINVVSEKKGKDYSKLREKIKKDRKIETKKYSISYNNGFIKIEKKKQ